jgi:hypothetical protein
MALKALSLCYEIERVRGTRGRGLCSPACTPNRTLIVGVRCCRPRQAMAANTQPAYRAERSHFGLTKEVWPRQTFGLNPGAPGPSTSDGEIHSKPAMLSPPCCPASRKAELCFPTHSKA